MNKHNLRKSFGFTIVELLVVIVVIGILATITVISYTGISQKATIASITSDLDNAFKQFKLFQVINGGYPTGIETNCTTASISTNICLKPNPNDSYTLSAVNNIIPNNQIFCLTVLNTSLNANYHITSDGLQSSGVCPYYLTLIAGSNGSVSASGSYDPGTVQTITATPSSTNYSFGSWTGDSGCSGLASHTITMDNNKTCTANFISSWIPGIAATAMAGKLVRIADLGSTYQFRTSSSMIASPQGAIGIDPNYPSLMSLVSPQVNLSVDFSGYPAQNACKAIGGRLPNVQELLAIFAGRATYGNNFTNYYWSATEASSGSIYVVIFSSGGLDNFLKTSNLYVRCVSG